MGSILLAATAFSLSLFCGPNGADRNYIRTVRETKIVTPSKASRITAMFCSIQEFNLERINPGQAILHFFQVAHPLESNQKELAGRP
jgi:hypothetical protein